VLIEQLPWESAYARSELGEQAQWGPVEHLLANISDIVAYQAYQFAKANRARNARRPDPIVRPGAKNKKKSRLEGASIDEKIAALQDQQLRRQMELERMGVDASGQ
jgi:hypothetical protein